MNFNFSTNFNWDCNNIYQGWRSFCMQGDMMLPFLGQTLWQVGPTPWIMSNAFGFGGPFSSPVGDQFIPSGSGGGGGSYSTKTKFNKLYEILEKHAETLSGEDKTNLEKALEKFADIEDKNKTSEKYEELLEVLSEYEDGIKEEALNDLKITADAKYTDLNLENLESTLDNDNILDVLSSWNSNSRSKGKHILDVLRSSNLENKQDIAVDLHNKLNAKANKLMNSNKIDKETQRDLKQALRKFDDIDNENILTDGAYKKAFNNLYRMCRLAEAEIVESKVIEKFKFLGENNPLEKGDVKNITQADLRRENVTVENSTVDDDEIILDNEEEVLLTEEDCEEPLSGSENNEEIDLNEDEQNQNDELIIELP